MIANALMWLQNEWPSRTCGARPHKCPSQHPSNHRATQIAYLKVQRLELHCMRRTGTHCIATRARYLCPGR